MYFKTFSSPCTSGSRFDSMCIALWGLNQPSVHRSDLTWIGLTEVYLGSGEDCRPSAWFTRWGKWSTHPRWVIVQAYNVWPSFGLKDIGSSFALIRKDGGSRWTNWYETVGIHECMHVLVCYANMTNMIRRQITVLPFEMETRWILSTEPGLKKVFHSFIHILSLWSCPSFRLLSAVHF